MEITNSYSKLERVTYKFKESDVQNALIEHIKKINWHKVSDGGLWNLEWEELDNGQISIELVHILETEKTKGQE